MTEMLKQVLRLALNESQIEVIALDYNTYCDKPLSELGIDSLYIMGIVLKIGEVTKKNIDFQNFSFDDINTLQKIDGFIAKHLKYEI